MKSSPSFVTDASAVVDYLSPEGPTVTHVRGSLLVATFQALRAQGLHDAYLAGLSPEVSDVVLNALAMSWVPLAQLRTHCAAGEALGLSERALHDIGRLAAQQMGESSLTTVWRGAQAMGMASGWWVCKQADRMWARLYQGGGCTVLQTGPKDAVFEAHGLVPLESPFYRACQHGFFLGMGRLLGSSCAVKPVAPRVPHPHRSAIALSWV